MNDTRRPRSEFFGGGEDSRFAFPAVGDERTMLADVLAAQRATLELKCTGLKAELALRSVEPSTLSLLGLVRHLADVERRWFRAVLAGQDGPPRFSSAENPDGDFDGAVPDSAVIAGAWQAWREEVALADAYVAEAPHLERRRPRRLAWAGLVALGAHPHDRGVRPAQRSRRSSS